MVAFKPELGDSGPFRSAHLPNKSRYELSGGHPVYCAPQGGDNAGATLSGGLVIGTDPAVRECGFDAGYSTAEKTLRAPDFAVGNVPDRPGWIAGVPQLALEYAGVGQDEAALVKKIDDLLDAGTRWVWVVRLLGPRHVEVHQKGCLVAHFGPEDLLSAPGVLFNQIPVKALYDREVAQNLALSNLLQRSGYRDLDDVRREGEARGRQEGIALGRARALVDLIRLRHLPLSDSEEQHILGCQDSAVMERWWSKALQVTAASELFTEPLSK